MENAPFDTTTETMQRSSNHDDLISAGSNQGTLDNAKNDDSARDHDGLLPGPVGENAVLPTPETLDAKPPIDGLATKPQSVDDMEGRIRKLKHEIKELEQSSEEGSQTRLVQAKEDKNETEKALKRVLEKNAAQRRVVTMLADQRTQLTQLKKRLERANASGKFRSAVELEYRKIPNLEASIGQLEGEIIRWAKDNPGFDAWVERDKTIGIPQDVLFESAKEKVARLDVYSRVRTQSKDGFDIEHLQVLTDQYEALDWLLNKIGTESDHEDLKDGVRTPAIPELKRKTWLEWKVHAEKVAPAEHYAVDLLCEEPPSTGLFGGARLHPPIGIPAVRESEKDQAPFAIPEQRLGIRTLPDSIRVNSVAAKFILDNLYDNNLRFYIKNPLLISAPFKILVYLAQEIQAKAAELEQIYQRRQEEGETLVLSGDRSVSKEQPFHIGFDLAKLTMAEVKEARDDFGCVKSFLDDYISPLRDHLQNRPEHVSFRELWHLFTPGSMIYVKDKSVPQKVWRVIQADGGRRYREPPEDEKLGKSWRGKSTSFNIHCYHLDYNGLRYVPTLSTFVIERFPENQPITSLLVLPLMVAEAGKLIDRSALVERGNQFVDCTKIRHRYYDGRSLSHNPVGKQLFKPIPESTETSRVYSERIESQVMIDFERALHAIPDWTPGTDNLTIAEAEAAEITDWYEDDSVWDRKFTEDFLDVAGKEWQEWEKEEKAPTGDNLLLLPDRVFGFVFRTRAWACLQLGKDSEGQQKLRKVPQQGDAWKDLEIAPQHKIIVQSLIDSHFEKGGSKDRGFDLVRDKGKGVTILLHGVPGVGKTSTAECVAESNNKPLLPITCGDLGLTAPEVEKNLQTDFQLAQAWNCILLLDEADIFLSARTNEDVSRNALVSVFLRVMEYYEGILFLTTNRVGAFDEAFRSRIHMALYYPPLKWHQTERIWKSHIRRAREKTPIKMDCDETELVVFASRLFDAQEKNVDGCGPVWNGRQIRNAFQSAITLARHENKAQAESDKAVLMTTEHFDTVAKVSNDFNKYLWQVNHKRSAGDKHSEQEIRYDSFGIKPVSRSGAQYQSPQFSPGLSMPMRQATPNLSTSLFQPPGQQSQPYAQNNGSPFASGQQLHNHQMYSNQSPPVFHIHGQPHSQQMQQQMQQPTQFYGGSSNQTPQQAVTRDNSHQYYSNQQPGIQQYAQTQGSNAQSYLQNQQPVSSASFPGQDVTSLNEQTQQSNSLYPGHPNQQLPAQSTTSNYPQQLYQVQQANASATMLPQGYTNPPERQAHSGTQSTQG